MSAGFLFIMGLLMLWLVITGRAAAMMKAILTGSSGT